MILLIGVTLNFTKLRILVQRIWIFNVIDVFYVRQISAWAKWSLRFTKHGGNRMKLGFIIPNIK